MWFLITLLYRNAYIIHNFWRRAFFSIFLNVLGLNLENLVTP